MLGPLECDSGGSFGRRDRAVLTVLAMYVGRSISADQLADALWGDNPPATSHKALQGCVVRLRKALGANAIETSAQGYRLTITADDIDSQRFERMVGRSRELLALGEPERAAYLLAQALGLWRGRAFEDVQSWEQANIEAGRLDELRLEAEELRVDACLRTGRHLDVLAAAEGMVKAAPMRERRWTLLALAQYQSGRQTEALRTIHRLKSLLADKLGLDPGPDLSSLEEAILRQDDWLLVQGPGLQSSTCPYQGLIPYDVDDSESFFGREDDARACLELLKSRGALSVVGPSGCGKSSLVRAGIAATLRRDSRSVVIITPGEHPMESLAAAPGAGPKSVLLVDQCEEAFSLCSDPAERQAFFAELVQRAERVPLVLAMRADRLTEVSAFPEFARLLERGLHLLGAMSEQGLRDAVEAPARQAGLLIEAGLVDLLVGEVKDTPGALPMLSHALLETWKRREGNTLTVVGYTTTGGIRGAVAQSAERVYASIDPGQRPLLRDLVLRLVTAGAEGVPVRSRVQRRLLSADPGHEHLIDLLVASRLVTSDAGIVEIAHEALARAWPRLSGWLEDDVEGQRILHHLSGAADAWNSMGRPDSELYRGVRASQALHWKAGHDTTLTDTEVAFLEATERTENSEQRAAAERARAQGRLIRRQRGVLVGATLLLVAALVAGVIALQQKGKAESNAATALDAQTAADARRVGAQALSTDDVDTSMLLALAGVRLDDSPETRSSLLATLGRHPELLASTQMTGKPIVYFDVSPDDRSVATYDTSNHVRLYDIRAGQLAAEFQAGPERKPQWLSGQVRFSPDGHTLAVVMAAPTRHPVMLLDADTLRPLPTQLGGLPRRRWQLLDFAYSDDGRHLAATMWRIRGSGITLRTTSSWAFVWDLDEPLRPTNRIRLEDDQYPGVALSPDGQVLYTTLPLMIHDLTSGTSVRVDKAEDVERLAISPNGRLLASPGGGGLLLRDAATGVLRRRLPGNDGFGYLVKFSRDGTKVATVTFGNREALVWEVATGDLLARLPLGESGEVVDFAADGATVYTAGSDSSLRHWDLDGGRRFFAQVAVIRPGELGWVETVQPAPGGAFVAYPAADGVNFFDVRAETIGDALERGTGFRPPHGGGSWHPEGDRYALATGGEIRIWDVHSGELTAMGHPSGPNVNAIDYSTDGSRLAIGELSGKVTMLDPTTLTAVGHPVTLDEPVRAVSAGPDNHTAFALTGQPATSFWAGSTTGWALVDLDSGKVLQQGSPGIDGFVIAFSPDGRHAAVGGLDGGVVVLDLETGEPLRPPVFLSHKTTVLSLAYSADGRQFVTSAADSSVALWNGETGLLAARVLTPQRYAAAAFIAGGESVLIATEGEGPIYEWDTSVEHAIEFACRVADRDFTEVEWTEVFGDRPYQQVCPS